MRRFIASGCWAGCLILPRWDAAGRGRRVGQIASTVGLEGRVGAAGAADASDVGLALRKAVKAAIRAASGVASTPGSIGARMRAGDGQCRQSSRDDDDTPHGNLLGDETSTLCWISDGAGRCGSKGLPRHAPADTGRPARSYSAVSPKKLSRAEALLRKRKSTTLCSATPRISVIDRDGCGFAPALSSQDLDRAVTGAADRLAP
jgi:hypothetical protein